MSDVTRALYANYMMIRPVSFDTKGELQLPPAVYEENSLLN